MRRWAGFPIRSEFSSAEILFGVAESFSNYWDSAFGDLYPLLFVLISLAIKPTGLFGELKADVR